jgi:hypothetical protein
VSWPENFESSQEIILSLEKAWKFLSGECAMFDVLVEMPTHPTFADFSVFLPLAVEAESRTAGVGVLIQREDATIVASHMFGLPKDDLNEDDLRDACTEVCNVFSGCVAPTVSAAHEIGIGLPKLASAADFDEISKGSVITLTYRCDQQIKRLFVLVYGVFLAPKAV